MSSTSASSTEQVHPYQVLLGPWSVGVSLAVVLGALVGAWLVDPGRIGIELCWLRALSDLPCPGCGLTRSVCHLARGEVVRAAWFHTFGLLVLPYSVFAASSLLWPEALRVRVRGSIDHHEKGIRQTYRVVVIAFLAYGLLRTIAVAARVWPAWG